MHQICYEFLQCKDATVCVKLLENHTNGICIMFEGELAFHGVGGTEGCLVLDGDELGGMVNIDGAALVHVCLGGLGEPWTPSGRIKTSRL